MGNNNNSRSVNLLFVFYLCNFQLSFLTVDLQKLIDRLQYPLHKVDIVEYARIFALEPNGDKTLFNLLVYGSDKVKAHAAWVFENMLLHDKQLRISWFYNIIEAMPKVQNQSVRRFLAKQVKLVLQGKNARFCVDEKNHVQEFNQLADICFEWLLSESSIVSVQSICIEVLICLMPVNSWVKAELPQIVQNMASVGSAAIRCKLNKIGAGNC